MIRTSSQAQISKHKVGDDENGIAAIQRRCRAGSH
jgi:hypothetical protein